MFPLMLDTKKMTIGLVIEGEIGMGRLELMEAAQAQSLVIFSQDPEISKRAGKRLAGVRPGPGDLGDAVAVFIAGIDRPEADDLAALVRSEKRLLNVEDQRDLCDFHVPSMVRRGDLTLAISTGGKSPGMARRLRQYLESHFGPEWAGYLDDVAQRRITWRSDGLSLKQVSARVEAYIEEKGWLK